MIIDNDHDRRQIELIKHYLSLYDKKSINLSRLIENLDGLYRSIWYLDKDLDHQFFQKWLDLESVYSGAVNMNRIELNEEEENIVTNATQKLKTIINGALDEYMKDPKQSVAKSALIIDDKWLMCPDCIDAWESTSKNAMVICPKCDKAFHNPRYQKIK